MILAVLLGEGGLNNHHYRQGRTQWMIKLKTERPQTEGGADFVEIKEEINRTPRPTKVQASWISQEIWRLADSRAALQQENRSSEWKVRQVRRDFQRSLRGYIQQQVK